MPPIPPTAKQVAINVAKQAAHEGNEIFKSAREQIITTSETPIKESPLDKGDSFKNLSNPSNESHPRNLSFLREYKQELDQIRRDNLFKELQRKIAEGEIIPLENYINELSYEQREVLKAQMEAMKIRLEQENSQKPSFPEIVAKKGRGMFNKIKKRNEQYVETRQPPSS